MDNTGYSLNLSQGLQKRDLKAESDLQAFKHLENLKNKCLKFYLVLFRHSTF